MPAPAVIPAPIAYIKVVAVKKLVVGRRPAPPRPRHLVLPRASVGGVGLARRSVRPFAVLGDGPVVGDVDLEQIEVLQASGQHWRERSSREWWKTTVVRIGFLPYT